jgi:hypothetical protein
VTGSYQVLDENQRLLGFALFEKGKVVGFTPNRLNGSQLNRVVADLANNDLDSYELVEIRVKNKSEEDGHSFRLTRADREASYRIRKTAKQRELAGLTEKQRREIEKFEKKEIQLV